MSVNRYNSTTGELEKIAGGTLYADAPIGAIQAYGGTTAPSGWLLCQGQAISRTEYADLFKAIGTAFGEGDSSTTFNVPDLREATTKGVGRTGKSSDHYSSSGVVLGEFIEDRIQGHNHTNSSLDYNASSQSAKNYAMAFKNGWATQTENLSRMEQSGYGVPRQGTTTEVKAIGVNYIIKAKQTTVPFDVAEYIRNQNVLSEWENITVPTAAANAITMEYDGILYINIGAPQGTFAYVYINGISFAIGESGNNSGGNNVTLTMPFKKGDVIYQSKSGSCKVAYYKLRDYTGR